MAKPGYGKRSAPNQLPRTRADFALLPARERYVAGFVDHLPEGAAMSVKQLAKQLPLYGQQAISSALTALSVAGHLRRVRCALGAGDETRWVFRTFWSRTAHDNEWWQAYLTAENTTQADSSAPDTPAPDTAPPSWVPDEEPPPPASEEPGTEQGPEPTPVPHQRTPDQAPDTQPVPPAPAPHPSEAGPSPAYLALARLGHEDHRLPLSADDCAELEPQAAEWLTRGVSVDYLITALTAGLPARVDTPLGFVRRRLTDKIPPRIPTTASASPGAPGTAPTRRILMECTDCGRPGQPEALPNGLCRPCRTTHRPDTDQVPIHPTDTADVKARMSNLRGLLRTV
ncbi:MarR family transcriptional regulator OS=Streptomyces microflavus OX=1919 GN=Smic_46600 PE=4 SV=1 [Streptomyces microflavus]